jgi:hypothetical protein
MGPGFLFVAKRHLFNDKYERNFTLFMVNYAGRRNYYSLFLKKQKTRTFYSYLDHYLRGIWYGFLVALLASILILIFYDYNLGMSMILFNMAWATFASGFVLELPSMKWGGGAGFVLSILSFIIPTPWKFFFMAFSTIVIYLIPGYNLKTQFQNKEKEQ